MARRVIRMVLYIWEFPKTSGAPKKTPTSRALIIRTSEKGAQNYRNSHKLGEPRPCLAVAIVAGVAAYSAVRPGGSA